jgi:Domain of unknown function (DUF5753)
MSEAALHQQIGGREILLGQLRHLIAMIEQLDTLDEPRTPRRIRHVA